MTYTAPADRESVVSLLAYFERLLAEHERWATEKFSSQDRALSLAKEADDRKHHDLNELRKEVLQDRSAYVLSTVYETKHDALMRELSILHKQVDILEARFATWIAAIAAFAVLLQAVGHYLWK